MFFRCWGNKKIQTVKIIDAGRTEIFCADYDPNYNRYTLEIMMKDGSVKKEYLVVERTALWKYGEFLNNPKDENYEHNSQYIDRNQKRSFCNIS